MKKIIRILGAGISGLTAAINLANAGYNVEVYERRGDCGKRFNSDFQGIENWSENEDSIKKIKRMGVKINFKMWPSKKIYVLDYKDDKFGFSSRRNLFYLVKRGCKEDCLDFALKKQAIKAGVKIFFNSKDNGEYDIIATGPSKVSGIARGMSFETNHKSVHIMQLNDKTSFKGYSYIFIANGHGSMATVLLDKYKDANDEFNAVKKHFLKKYNIKIKDPKEWGGFGSFSLNGPYKRGKKMIVGEEAGLQDYLWGFGMKSAFTSGYLAARSIIERKDYKKLIKENYKNYLRNSLVNRMIWESLGNWGYKEFLEIARIFGDPYPLLNKIYKYSLSKKILYPFAYLKLRSRLK